MIRCVVFSIACIRFCGCTCSMARALVGLRGLSADASAWGNPYVVGVVGRGLEQDGLPDCLEEMQVPPRIKHPHGHSLQLSFISLFRSIYPKLLFSEIFELHSQYPHGTDSGFSFLSFLLRPFLAPLIPATRVLSSLK